MFSTLLLFRIETGCAIFYLYSFAEWGRSKIENVKERENGGCAMSDYRVVQVL